MSTHCGILLHVVFSTKFRRRVLSDAWRDELFAYIGGVVVDDEAVLLCSGGIEDHIHLLLSIHPSYSISKTIQSIKANSSRWINQQRKLPSEFRWQRGYGCFSVSQSQREKVTCYIKNQREHHRIRTFEEEYLLILQKHSVEFDLRYVFEQEYFA